MPYSPEHKEKSKQRILSSAYALFSANGYSNISINQIMADASMTRGAFYAHFKNKSALYREAILYAAENTAIVRHKPDELNDREWIKKLIEGYLHKQNISNDCRCPLASLVTDVTVREPDVRNAYTSTFKGLNKRIAKYTQNYSSASNDAILATTAMMIGGLAIARAVDDQKLSERLLKVCIKQALCLLNDD
ncbi:MAG: TetR/AcrR family transcriptional regulator [Gammaproteobacteria bacterium]|nr:TetR/AcrR family transcriptional regulator [Gammaproteobacteria bacterium]